MSKPGVSADTEPVVINDDNLSRAWSRLLLRAFDGVGTKVPSLFLSVTGFRENGIASECPAVRQALDELLHRKGRTDVEGVAFAIFPQRIWAMSRGDRAQFFDLYRRAFPRFQAIKRTANRRGMYFERLVKYGRGPCDGNQLEWILSQYSRRKSVRSSMLQATTFDPGRDHIANAQLGFPCLQQISFVPTEDGLVINAFYATQQIFDKAYGNYLGLTQLGAFMAHELNIRLARLNVMVGLAKLERIGKRDRDLEPLVAAARALVSGVVSSSGNDCEVNTSSAQPYEFSIRRKRRGSPKEGGEPATIAAPLLSLFQRQHAKSISARAGTVSGTIVMPHLSPAKVSDVYDSLWRFAAQRQEIFFRRVRREPPPWANDAVLAKYKFTNAYRASDRVSQYLIRHVIYRADLPDSPREVFFRILLFKLFNRIDTWKLLERSFGPITFEDYDFTHYDEVLAQQIQNGGRIYSAAYIMPPGNRAFGRPAKHQNHLLLLGRMMEDRVPERLAQARTMQEAFEKLRAYPTVGDFLAYQFITDINYSEITDFSEMEFVVPGPGARDGLRKCFVDAGGLNEPELIRLVADLQEKEFERLELDFQTLWGRRLQLIDCQNLFCEVGKYARVVHPEIEGSTGRTRIKQKFQPTLTPMHLFYPPKWELNAKIYADADTPLGNPDGARDVNG